MKYYNVVKKEFYPNFNIEIILTAKVCEKTKTFHVSDGFMSIPKGSKTISEKDFLNLIKSYKPMTKTKKYEWKAYKIDLRNGNIVEL